MERAGHPLHMLLDVAPTSVENFPDSHSLHGAVPGAVLNLPALHCVQAPPLLPLLPELHRQAKMLLLAAGESEWSGHVVHSAGPR